MNLFKTLVAGVALLALPSAAQAFDCWDDDLWSSGYDEICEVEVPPNENAPDNTEVGDRDDVKDAGDFTAASSSGSNYDELNEKELSELIQSYQPPEPTEDLPLTGFGDDADDEYWEEQEYNSCVDDAGELNTESTASCAGSDDYDTCMATASDSYSDDVSSCDE